MTTRWFVLLMMMVCLVVLLSGCEPDPTATPMPTSGPKAVPPTPTSGVVLGPEPPPTTEAEPTSKPVQASAKPVPPKAGNPAYPFSLQDLEGNEVSLASFQGKYLMLNFWASWCGPCRAEIPHMVALRDELQDDGFEILAVNLREDKSKVVPFVEQMDMRFPVVMDIKGEIGAAYFVRGIPTSVFIDPDGVIRFVHTGTLTDAQLRQYVKQLMQ